MTPVSIPTSVPQPKAVAIGPDWLAVGGYGFQGGLELFQRAGDSFLTMQTLALGRIRGLCRLDARRVIATVRREHGGDVQVVEIGGAMWTVEFIRQFCGNPVGVATDERDNLYLLDIPAWTGSDIGAGNRAYRCAIDGQLLASWGNTGHGPGEFNLPVGIAVAPDGEVFIADTFNSRIQVFTPDGAFLRSWGTPETLNCPQGIAVGPDGRIYVADTGNHRVCVYSTEGTPVEEWGGFGTEPGEFWLPCGIAVDDDRTVYVADTMNGRLQVFRGGMA